MPLFPDFDNTPPGCISGGALKVLAFCRLASTGNVNVQGLNAGDSMDGETIAEGDRIAIIAQTDATENGVYLMDDHGLSRATDFDSIAELGSGVIVPILEGATYANKAFKVIPPAGAIDAVDIAFAAYGNWMPTTSISLATQAFDNTAPVAATLVSQAFENDAPASKSIAGTTFDNTAPESIE